MLEITMNNGTVLKAENAKELREAMELLGLAIAATMPSDKNHKPKEAKPNKGDAEIVPYEKMYKYQQKYADAMVNAARRAGYPNAYAQVEIVKTEKCPKSKGYLWVYPEPGKTDFGKKIETPNQGWRLCRKAQNHKGAYYLNLNVKNK